MVLNYKAPAENFLKPIIEQRYDYGQQHIHDKLMEMAKEKLSTTDLRVSEIAYELGFEHPQSFSKLRFRLWNSDSHSINKVTAADKFDLNLFGGSS
jgi:AraC-like DNA-binding protein